MVIQYSYKIGKGEATTTYAVCGSTVCNFLNYFYISTLTNLSKEGRIVQLGSIVGKADESGL